MKKINVLVSFLLIFFSGSVFSQGTTEQSKTWSWTATLGNYYFGGTSTLNSGIGLHQFTSDSEAISIELLAGTNFDFLSSIGGNTVNASSKKLGFYWKSFPKKSFYFRTGLQADSIHYEVKHYAFLSGTNTKQTADLVSYSLFLGLGNQWIIRNFTIGCDWFGIYVPFAESGYTESSDGTPSSDWDVRGRMRWTRISVLNFYLGMVF